MTDRSPWDQNEYGLWCPACGYHIATTRELDEEADFIGPGACRQCGYPDFEDDCSYFTDDTP